MEWLAHLHVKICLAIRKLYRLHLYIVTLYNFIIFVLGYNMMDHLCYLCLVIFTLLRQFIAALWSPAVKELTFGSCL